MREFNLDNRFCLYGQEAISRGVSLAELVHLQKTTNGDLLARPENSGSEGIYCEVARWNHATDRWERFAFRKYLGGAQDQDARDAANEINNAAWHYGDMTVVHRMPNWTSDRRQEMGVAVAMEEVPA